jgi:nucleotide-binding universal stress UspA family protein
MFKSVVWATDGSDAANRALRLARTLVEESGGEMLVVHCIEFTLPGKGPGGMFPVHTNEDELRVQIERQVSELTDNGVQATLAVERTRVGGAAHVIADLSRERGADLIVVGTRGHTALGGLLLGSVTQRLLQIADCPVLAVPSRRVAQK